MVYMTFDIDDGASSPPGSCQLVVTVPPQYDAKTYSWYNQQCIDIGWWASWGYDSSEDSAVLTLVK